MGTDAGAVELQHEDLVHLSVPTRARPLSQMTPSQQTGLVIVGPEIRGSGLWIVDRYHGDVGFAIGLGNHGADLFANLVFDDQIHSLTDELLRIAKRHCRLVAVVKRQHLQFAAAVDHARRLSATARVKRMSIPGAP